MRSFSMGLIYALSTAANPTPIPVASVKGAKATVKQSKKVFRGNQRDIQDVGDGARDWTLEFQIADFRAEQLGLVVPNLTPATGGPNVSMAEQFTIPGTPFQVTVAQGANYKENSGVYDLTAGKWMKNGATASASGIYSYNAGTGQYTFNTADASHVVLISYTYNSASLGRTTTVQNTIQSQSVPYKVRLYNPYAVPGGTTRLLGLDFYSVHFEELDLDVKVEDFMAHNLKGFASQDMLTGTLKTCDVYDSELG